ncbi:hypothetical protein NX059_008771 [Plenodomus lindquistii]|nr:hypothetical protein NX059_008771 [Plenodomus lindquistii]
MAMIQPGLQRISQLLKNVDFPWKAIHVAGTNGKGSVCHYASSLLTNKQIKCGKFTSPHLVDRWDCISINNQPVDENFFKRVEKHFIRRNLQENINASPFEILTATAFQIFNVKNVEIGVIEVGMGGKLDATNILQNQHISVITKIARDHEAFLGNTLAQIALHKAGILRPNIPYIVSPSNPWNVHNVIDEYAEEIGAGPRLTGDAPELQRLYSSSGWVQFASRLQPFQRDNAVLAMVAATEACKSLKFADQIANKLWIFGKEPNHGRCEEVHVLAVFGHGANPGRRILVDGAHNPDAAIALNEHVDVHQRQRTIKGQRPRKSGWPVTWVLAMTEGKDARRYLQYLLRPGDNVITTSFGPVDGMPWVKPMDPKELLDIAQSVEPGIFGLHIPQAEPLRALCAAKHLVKGEQPIVLTGSLYFVGDLHREIRSRSHPEYLTGKKSENDREMFQRILEEERMRVKQALSRASVGDSDVDIGASVQLHLSEEQQKRLGDREKREQMLLEIRALDDELKRVEEAERTIPSPSVFHAERLAATMITADGADSQEEQSEPTSTSSLKQQYGKALGEIRAKLRALQASAEVAAPTAAVDIEAEKIQETASDVPEEGVEEQNQETPEMMTSQDQDDNKKNETT